MASTFIGKKITCPFEQNIFALRNTFKGLNTSESEKRNANSFGMQKNSPSYNYRSDHMSDALSYYNQTEGSFPVD